MSCASSVHMVDSHDMQTTQEAEHKCHKSTPTLLTAVGPKSGTVADAKGVTALCQQQSGPAMQDQIKVHVTFSGGDVYDVDTRLSARVGDVKAAIHKQLGYSPLRQTLVLGETVLADMDTVLRDIGVAHESMLTLLIGRENIGQSSLETPDGKKFAILSRRAAWSEPLEEYLNEFQLMSLRAAARGDGSHNDDDDDDQDIWNRFPLGHSGLDFYWTTRSDGCRYEYWSSDPGDNEYGILVRVDDDAMTAIGHGRDDGIRLFDEFREELQENESIAELLKEGWPRFQREDSDEGEEDEDDSDEDEED